MLRTCVAPTGRFVYGVHSPSIEVENLREKDYLDTLGYGPDGVPVSNASNFPTGAVKSTESDRVYEIPNAFPFRGVTYINKRWADRIALHPGAIELPAQTPVSLTRVLEGWFPEKPPSSDDLLRIFKTLPEPLQLALAANSTDPEDLVRLAEESCRIVHDPKTGCPTGLGYTRNAEGRLEPDIGNPVLFEVVANNAFLPDDYKEIMVLRPGAQGNSEIVGEWRRKKNRSHVFEYLRRNSYIPWGHFAANMAHDAVRYRINELTAADMRGLRHLYYQRIYVSLARYVGIPISADRKTLSITKLENLRRGICRALRSARKRSAFPFSGTLWGWNFGFDFAPSKYRLHASHQQVHQQYALLPATVSAGDRSGQTVAAYACGDLVGEFIETYHRENGRHFFETYLQAIQNNRRMDGDPNRERSLIVFENERVIVFVPKAQTSQWELQVMPLNPVGNILEADTTDRACMDEAIHTAVRILEAMGARMITGVEYSKRFDSQNADHRLLYCFLPRHPESPGAFSEAQLRWISPHYPEDFAAACRARLPEALEGLPAGQDLPGSR